MEIRHHRWPVLGKKGNRKRPLRERGDRRGGEGEKGEVVLERKKVKQGEERGTEAMQDINDLLHPKDVCFVSVKCSFTSGHSSLCSEQSKK